MGFGAVPDGQKAALKWYYDRFLLAKDTEQGVPYDIPLIGVGPKLTVRFLTAGPVPEPSVKDYVATFGKRTVAFKDGNIVLGKVE